MNLLKSKKGFTYLIAATLLSMIIIFVFLAVNKYTYQDRQDLHENRIVVMNDFVTDFNQDIHRATYISSFRTLLALEDYISNAEEFFNDTEIAFAETFFNGTISGQVAPLLNDSSFLDYLDKVNSLARHIGLTANMTVLAVHLNQSSPWAVDVGVDMAINITDTTGIASWEFEQTYVTTVPIYDLRDPLYSVFTYNRLSNTIRVFPETFLVNTTDNDTSNLQKFLNDSYYLANPNAPSFLQRFENNITSHPQGIESVVNVGLLAAQDIDVYENRIKVDYMYFNAIAGSKVCAVDGVSSSFYFVTTQDRVGLYEISGLDYNNVTCP
ncbi:hypothetical protein K9M74_04400 [Candidatus Woesearchaeota archaeon]|nr:hypothetical protein [Candidatus Woesearchaeota archaeon]